MSRNILVPLDGSKEAEAILPEVQRIATLQDHVHFLHLVPHVHAPAGNEVAHAIGLLEQALALLQATRARWLPDQRGLDLVREGDPASEILRAALEKNINLIAMSTQGRSGFGRFLMGSVAAEVVRKAQLPVLLTRPDGAKTVRPLRRILVGVEGRETPHELLETVKSLAGGLKVEIILLHAVSPVIDPAPVWETPLKLSVLDTPEHRLQDLADAVEREGYAVRPVISDGMPVETILAVSRTLDVDLIALATHARTGLERFLEGSVAEGVLRRSPVAVLLQKPLVSKKSVLQEERHA